MIAFSRADARRAMLCALATATMALSTGPMRAQGGPPGGDPGIPEGCLTEEHVHVFTDRGDVLASPGLSVATLRGVLSQAATEVIDTYGDRFDFIGFWLDFDDGGDQVQRHFRVKNDVLGIGLPIEDHHAALGIPGERLRGMVYMDNVARTQGEPGTDFTRRILGHEFAHAWVLFIPEIEVDGLTVRVGNDGLSACGGSVSHWHPLTDTNGGSNDGQEWVGSDPAVRSSTFPRAFTDNTDTGGLWSYANLYLMGYVSPQEMDAGQSELRYMLDNAATCAQEYFGPIVSFSSTELIAAAGERIPDSTTSQKDYRVGWVLIHPDRGRAARRNVRRVVDNALQLAADWRFSTLGRGSIDNTLFDDCNCNGVPDADDVFAGDSPDANGNGVPDECES